MRDVTAELKSLRLYGMASAWTDLTAQGGLAALESSRWLIEHLLQAESTDRAMRSIGYQMKAARFPIHRDLAGFDFEQSAVDRRLISELADLGFTDDAELDTDYCVCSCCRHFRHLPYNHRNWKRRSCPY